MADVARSYEGAVDLLHRASTEHGFVASPAFDHYSVIWVRDAAVSSLGALVSGDDELVACAVRSLETMSRSTTPLGQVAAVSRPDRGYADWGEGGVVDATAWYVILAGAVSETTGDDELLARQWPTVAKAINWLRHQDVTGSGLISAAPSTDWMDASLVRSGRTLHLNILYHWAASSAARIARSIGEASPLDPKDLFWRVNGLFWPTETTGPEMLLSPAPRTFPHPATVRAHAAAAARDRVHYVSHVIHSHFDEHCDVLANLIAVCTGIASETRSASILDYLADRGVTNPYPSRVWADPIDTGRPGSLHVPEVEEHLDPRWRNPPFSYHNGAVWPFVGGFHCMALGLAGRREEGWELLERLGDANLVGDRGFHEWLHGQTGEPSGAPEQAWNAGAYVLATQTLQDPAHIRYLFC